MTSTSFSILLVRKRKTTTMGTSYSKNNKRKNQDLDHKVTQCYLNGNNIENVSRILKLSKEKITSILKRKLTARAKRRESGKRFNFKDRRTIEFFLDLGCSRCKIAKMFGCHVSTISYELKRCEKSERYCAAEAQSDYNRLNHSLRGPRKLEECREFLNCFCEFFKEEKMSPVSFCLGADSASRRFPEFTHKVCMKTIYNYIHRDCLDVKFSDLPRAPLRKVKRERFYKRKDGKHTKGLSIDQRPFILKDEKGRILEFGNWELDCLAGTKGKDEPVLLVLVEKMTHFTMLVRLESQDFPNVLRALHRIKDYFKSNWNKVFQTITTDNGSEFLGLAEEEDFKDIVYFCHPAQPKEKPQVERMNGNIRMYFPKGESLKPVDENQVAFVQDCLNEHCRVSLEGYCAQDLFEDELDLIYNF